MKEIEEKIKNKKFPLPDLGIKKDLKAQSDFRNLHSSSNEFNVIKLYEEGRYLAKKIVIELSKRKIPFNKISVNLLLDCSGFISIENKLKQFTIICGIVNSFNILNIQYAISIVGDSQFNSTLKPFDVEHSMKYLQKVLDCLFIKRFTGKNANFIHYAIKFTNAKTPYRAFLIFTNGLDEDFLLINSWKNKIITNPNFTFGFFFINSENLINNHFEELNYLKIKWNEFKKNLENVELLYYKSTLENYNNLYNNIAFVIGNLLERQIEEEKAMSIEFNLPEFDLIKYIKENNLIINSINKYEKALEANFENLTEIYFKKINDLKLILNKIYKLNNNYYKNKLSKIGKYELKEEKLKNDIHLYAEKFIDNRAKLNKAKIELIFKPNKASQKVLSTSGTELDIPALIMNLIKPSPDPMIYLEEKGGMIRKYSVSLIIDTSYSCFNPLSFSFSLQTIRVILSSLASIDLPSFDLILTTQKNPLVLCSNINTIRAINSKSLLWESLISILDNPCQKSDLASAIEAAFDLKRKKSFEFTSYLFVLTDGLFQENEYKRILTAVNNCIKSGLNIFGIGIGIYPIRNENLFPRVIYCPNPYNINKAISNFLDGTFSGYKEEMQPIEENNENHLIDLNNKILEFIDNSSLKNYQNLYDELNKIIIETDAFSLITNEEDEMKNIGNIKSNPTGEGKELLKKDALKGQKILIVMLWSKTLNSDENECIHKDYLTKPSPESEACLKDALDFLGITMDIVENYRDAIERITSKTDDGKCPYYAIWVINGPPFEDLPDGSKESFLFGQFLEVLKIFWEKGGALIFLAEGWKLQYQTNEFLKMIDFDGEKVDFYLVGDDEKKGFIEHKGGKFLEADYSGKLEKAQTFSKKIELFGGLQREKLSHNLFILFEGDTICYASTDESKKLYPFHPFSRDSENGISSLFYLSDTKKRGDIFIDCGFTKLFINMKKDDTAFRYFQNIASWSARTSIHLYYDNIDVKLWRPESINYEIDINKKWTKFIKKKEKNKLFYQIDDKSKLIKMKVLFAFDNSGSISNNKIYFKEVDRIVKKYYKDGDKFYLWGNTYSEKSKVEIEKWIKEEKGPEGTYPSNIAECCLKNPNIREHLIIVTDGQVEEREIEKSDELMKKYQIKFKFVSVYVVGTKGNLSVGAPYCRECPNRTINIINENKRFRGPSISLQQIDKYNNLNKITSLSKFNSIYNDLFLAIYVKQLGKKYNSDIKDKLEKLKSNIIEKIKENNKIEFEKKWKELFDMAIYGTHDYEFGTAEIKRYYNK